MLKNKTMKIVLGIVILISIIITIRVVTKSPEDNNISDNRVREVKVATVSELTKNTSPLPLIGNVEPLSQGDLRAEVGGEIIRVYKNLGDPVQAGQIIAEIENASQRAGVIQAEGVLEQANANLAKAEKGVRDESAQILSINLASALNSLIDTQANTVNVLNNAYTTTDDAIRNKIDEFYSQPRGTNPEIIFSSSDSQVVIDANWERLLMENFLNKWADELDSLNNKSDLEKALENGSGYVKQARALLDKVAKIINALEPDANKTQTQINTWKGTVSTARTNINSALGTLTTTKDTLRNKKVAADIAGQENASGSTRDEDLASVKAGQKQALGALRVAQASLEKTLVRAPVTGTINSLNVKRGSFVSLFDQIATVSNNSALEIVTFITEENINDVVVGGEVIIEGKWKGAVTKVAPAINPQTKKIEVKVGIKDKETELSNGESVRLSLNRANQDKDDSEIRIPISTLKIKSDGIYVFSVNDENILVAHKIEIGPIVGNKVIIKKGVESNLKVVIDARGLKEGQVVALTE